jgi:hypothetical protein
LGHDCLAQNGVCFVEAGLLLAAKLRIGFEGQPGFSPGRLLRIVARITIENGKRAEIYFEFFTAIVRFVMDVYASN